MVAPADYIVSVNKPAQVYCRGALSLEDHGMTPWQQRFSLQEEGACRIQIFTKGSKRYLSMHNPAHKLLKGHSTQISFCIQETFLDSDSVTLN